MRSMQRELEELKEARQREALQAEEDREELHIYRDRVNKLEDERELRGDVSRLSVCFELSLKL